LEQLGEHLGQERRVCVSRELTKIYEENRRGTLAEIIRWYKEHPPKGEIVIVVEGIRQTESFAEMEDREG
jgi:16S rRNA (cytidine1402-2'-O)-methyltransferase